MVNLQIILCGHRNIDCDTVKSLEKFRLHTQLLYNIAVFTGDALIGRSRSRSCTQYLDAHTAPYMLFIDDDMVFEAEHIQRLYLDMVQGYDLIAGCYAVKDGSQLASYGWKGAVDFNGKIQDMEYLATGFLGISWNCLDTIRKKLDMKIVNPTDPIRCYPFFESGGYYEEREGGMPAIYISEDWDFCLKARKAGFKCYLDTAVWVGHRGPQTYTLEMVINSQLKQIADKERAQKDADSKSSE